VKVNHLRNCLLCHAPSTATSDPVRGFIPVPGEPIPVVYYGHNKGDFVRADIAYFRQDFSVMERVDEPNKWPAVQRFDYLVRKRKLSDAPRSDGRAAEPRTSPHRAALLHAIGELVRQQESP